MRVTAWAVALTLSGCLREHRDDRPAPEPAPLPSAPPAAPATQPIEVLPIEVPGDVPAFHLRGAPGTRGRTVFLHGRCAHAQGYVQAFQFAAAKRGSVVAPQGDIACEGAYRRWTVDPVLQDRRIEAAFRAAGESGPLRDIVVIGYSQGEVLAEHLVERFPDRYTRAVLMGAPSVPTVSRLRTLRACVTVSGERDARDLMKEGARRLLAAGVPSTYVEMPRALHNQMIEGERTMEEVFAWLDAHSR